ncbi:MAG TPA: SagB/ThcOx family dehydrogenase [Allosphingosinicella sp.]
MTLAFSVINDARDELVGERNLFSVSEMFHENSRITGAAPRLPDRAGARIVAPTGFKRYVHSPRLVLPAARRNPIGDVGEAIRRRRSCRYYCGAELSLQQLAELLFLTLGCHEENCRCVPSAGGLYPLELYVAASRVEGLPAGLYHYDPRAHALAALRDVDCMALISDAVFIPEATEGAAAVLLITAMFGRSKLKYGERAYRFALLEAGHGMQNILLVATALDLGACPVGGFIDDRLNDLLDIDGVEEAALYAAIIGRPDDPHR